MLQLVQLQDPPIDSSLPPRSSEASLALDLTTKLHSELDQLCNLYLALAF